MVVNDATRQAQLQLPPSVPNGIPLPGWHRHIILGGDVLGPHEACVTYWPPYDSRAEEPRRLLRSQPEVKEWLSACGAIDRLPLFGFDVEACLSAALPDATADPVVRGANSGRFAPSRGAVAPLDSAPYGGSARKFGERDIYVEAALGFAINRFFEFVDEETFLYTHHSELRGFRRSVVADIVRQCRERKAQRREANALWRREKRLCQPFAVAEARKNVDYRPASSSSSSARQPVVAHDRPGSSKSPRDDDGNGVGVLDVSGFSLRGVNLLYHAHATLDGNEFRLATPHLRRLCEGVYELDLLAPEFCRRLLRLAIAFRASTRGACSATAGDACLEPPRIALDKLGLSAAIADVLLEAVARPLAARLFPNEGGATLDHHVAFVDTRSANVVSADPWVIPTTRQAKGADRYDCALQDDADIVLDVCLAVAEHGATDDKPTREYLGSFDKLEMPAVGVAHVAVGHALLYSGKVRHRRLVGSAERASLVLWCRSARHRDEDACDGDEYYDNERLYSPLDGAAAADDDYLTCDCYKGDDLEQRPLASSE